MPEHDVRVIIQKDHTLYWRPGDDSWGEQVKQYTSITYLPRTLRWTTKNGKIFGASATGPRILKGGKHGQDVVEIFYSGSDVPSWANDLITFNEGKGDSDA